MHRTFFFGYGSLMYPSGINGRGMRYKYDWKDLAPATLFGYKRDMSARLYTHNYYGLVPSKNNRANGIVFEIHTEHDLKELLVNEFAAEVWGHTGRELLYNVENISAKIEPQFEGKVLVLVSIEDRSGYGKVAESYVRHVYNGIQPWGEKFVEEFLKTGGLKPKKEKEIVPSYYIMRRFKDLYLRIRNRGWR